MPAYPVVRIGGHPFLAHTREGNCIYLDPGRNLCRLQMRAGAAAKPLGCRIYPLNIASTGAGEVTVAARMDCPAVQRNAGAPLEQNRSRIEEYVRQLGVAGDYTAKERRGLSDGTLAAIRDALLCRLVRRRDIPLPTRAAALADAAGRLESLDASLLNEAQLRGELLTAMIDKSLSAAAVPPGQSIGRFSRAVFLQLLAAYLRRDEEMLNRGVGPRLARTWTLGLLLVGRGSLAPLGREHPRIPLARVGLFRNRPPPAGSATPPAAIMDSAAEVWECYERYLDAKIESRQFFGVTYYRQPLVIGLKALALTFPLVLAAARCRAADRGAPAPAAEDVQYAVGAIDHSFGRSPLLAAGLWRSLENYFAGARFPRLVSGICG